MAKYKRILLKLSGESLMGEKQYGIDEKRLAEYAAQIKEIHEQGVQIGIVIGGGNIFRGLSGANKGFDRVNARGPLAELYRYSTTLSSLSSGAATYTMKFASYEQVPADVQDKLLKAYTDTDEE